MFTVTNNSSTRTIESFRIMYVFSDEEDNDVQSTDGSNSRYTVWTYTNQIAPGGTYTPNTANYSTTTWDSSEIERAYIIAIEVTYTDETTVEYRNTGYSSSDYNWP